MTSLFALLTKLYFATHTPIPNVSASASNPAQRKKQASVPNASLRGGRQRSEQAATLSSPFFSPRLSFQTSRQQGASLSAPHVNKHKGGDVGTQSVMRFSQSQPQAADAGVASRHHLNLFLTQHTKTHNSTNDKTHD